jgi:hypothetical protein
LEIEDLLDKYVQPSNDLKIIRSFKYSGREWEAVALIEGIFREDVIMSRGFERLLEPDASGYASIVSMRLNENKSPVAVYSRFDEASGVMVILVNYDFGRWACYLRRI